MSMYHAEPNRSEPESWKTISYTVRRPGNTAWAEGITSLADARRECERANRVIAVGHRVYAEQEYLGDVDGVPSTRTVER